MNKLEEYQNFHNKGSNTLWNKQFSKWLLYKNYIKSSDEVLDLGCGNKELISSIKDKVKKAEGYDYPEIDLENDLKFNNEFYDVIILQMVIEHITNYMNLIRECKRILKTNGRLIIITYDAEKFYAGFISELTHVTPFSISRLKKVSEVFKLKTLLLKHFRPIPKLWKYNFKAFNYTYPTSDIIAIYQKENRE